MLPHLDKVDWSDALYQRGQGITRQKLQINEFVELLYQRACQACGWPAQGRGRVIFYACVEKGLREGKGGSGPGKLLTKAVRERVFQNNPRWWQDDYARANQRLGQAPDKVTEPEKPPRDYSEIDRQIAETPLDELRPLVFPGYRGLFDRDVEAGKDPRHDMVLTSLRKVFSERTPVLELEHAT